MQVIIRRGWVCWGRPGWRRCRWGRCRRDPSCCPGFCGTLDLELDQIMTQDLCMNWVVNVGFGREPMKEMNVCFKESIHIVLHFGDPALLYQDLSILNEINRTRCRSRIWGWGGRGCRCRAAGPDPGSRTCQHSWKFRHGRGCLQSNKFW